MIERPDRDEWLMRMAVVTSTRGTCERASVGAIIAKEGRIISTGYVGAPSGQPHCVSVGCEIGVDGGCTRTVHAEANAIAFAARIGASTDNAELHCTHSPCLSCAKLIINAGIRRLVYEHEYRIRDGLTLLETAGLDVVQLPAPTMTPEEFQRWYTNNPNSALHRDSERVGW
jgi:dCMP deaminase